MIRHTTLNLDSELLDEAKVALNTKRITDTVHRALEDVVLRRRRMTLLSRELPDLTPAAVEEMRTSPR
jgi:hypothetical protein